MKKAYMCIVLGLGMFPMPVMATDWSKFDKFDKEDSQSIQTLIKEANTCTQQEKFSCAENKIKEAKDIYSIKLPDKNAISVAEQKLKKKRHQVAERIRRQEEEERRRAAASNSYGEGFSIRNMRIEGNSIYYDLYNDGEKVAFRTDGYISFDGKSYEISLNGVRGMWSPGESWVQIFSTNCNENGHWGMQLGDALRMFANCSLSN